MKCIAAIKAYAGSKILDEMNSNEIIHKNGSENFSYGLGICDDAFLKSYCDFLMNYKNY